MSLSFDDALGTWRAEIHHVIQHGVAVALGVFDAAGAPLYLNAGMCALLCPADAATPDLEYLMVPRFDALLEPPADGEIVYDGWFTFGGPDLLDRSLRGTVRRREDRLLLLCAYDVEQMEAINRQITQLNDQITNLQRELARKNALLERTLAKLRETQAMLVQSEKMNALGQMVAGVAHEINNPVSFVTSNLHSLKAAIQDVIAAFKALEELALAGTPDDRRAQVERLRAAADLDFLEDDIGDLFDASLEGLARVKGLVASLRNFSRLDEAECKEASLNECIHSALRVAGPQLTENAVEVRLDLPNLPPLKCFPAELNQVFLNIIINAAQAMPGGGTLTIQTSDQGTVQVAQFTDTGPGMPPGVCAKVFDPFFTTKPVGSGTGLGLAIAYKIITEHHQGTIAVESEPGMGTTFTVTLPKRRTS